jgi:hypothetical protein
MPKRLLSFAGSAVMVKYEGPQPERIIDFLYRDVDDDGGIVPHSTFCLTENAAGQLQLTQDGELLYEGDSIAAAADLLLGKSCYHLADRSERGLLFHAGGLCRQGKGLLLPGTMGAGKTTLAAWLLGRGFDYLTDELVFVPQETRTMWPFPRPLNLKRPARFLFEAQINFDDSNDQILSADTTDLIPPTLFNPNTSLSEPQLDLIIFPNYQAGNDFELCHLSKAQTGLELMQCLINARNLSGHGFPEVTRLARSVPAYKMTYSSFAQIESQIDLLLAAV